MKTRAAIVCGGRGTRLWPRSRRSTPKPFLSLFGGHTLLDRAIDRASQLCGSDGVWLVGSAEHQPLIQKSPLRIPPGQIILEPRPRNTAAAVALAAAVISAGADDPTIVCTPADHHIGDPDAFVRALRRAADLAAASDALVILGIKPTQPETGFGYIELGEPVADEHPIPCRRVAAFREKPDQRTAMEYLAGGKHLWNAGVFVARSSHFEHLLTTHAPQIGERIPELRRAFAAGTLPQVLRQVYEEVPAISFDRAVLERCGDVLVVACEAPWSDVGTWQAVYEFAPKDADGNVAWGEVLARDTQSCVIMGDGGKIVTLGVSDLVIVANDRALLVADRNRSQEIGTLVSEIAALPGWADCL